MRRPILLSYAGLALLAFATAAVGWLRATSAGLAWFTGGVALVPTSGDGDLAVALSAVALLALWPVGGLLWSFRRPVLPCRPAVSVPGLEPTPRRLLVLAQGLGARVGFWGAARALLQAARLGGTMRIGEGPVFLPGRVAVVPPVVLPQTTAAGGDPHSDGPARPTRGRVTDDDL